MGTAAFLFLWAASLAARRPRTSPIGIHVSASVGFVMVHTMKESAPMKSSIAAGDSAMSAASALDRVRPMLVAIGGPRSWDDTKDHWRNRLARKVGINARRVRAILSKNEDVRLSADEYLSIEARFRALDERLAEDLRALSASHRDAPAGQVRAGGATDPGAGRQGPGTTQARVLADGR